MMMMMTEMTITRVDGSIESGVEGNVSMRNWDWSMGIVCVQWIIYGHGVNHLDYMGTQKGTKRKF